MPMLHIVVSILLGAALGMVVVLPKLRLEMRWKQKQEAYDRVLDALHEMQEVLNHEVEIVVGERSEDDDERAQVNATAYRVAKKEVVRGRVLGGYLFNREAQRRLKEYLRDLDVARNTQWADEFVLARHNATHECVKDMIDIARRDLSILPRWWYWIARRLPKAFDKLRIFRQYDED